MIKISSHERLPWSPSCISTWMQFFITPEILCDKLLVYWICRYVVMPTISPTIPATSQPRLFPTHENPEEKRERQLAAMLPDHGHFPERLFRSSQRRLPGRAEGESDSCWSSCRTWAASCCPPRWTDNASGRSCRTCRPRWRQRRRACRGERSWSRHRHLRCSWVEEREEDYPITTVMQERTVRREDFSPKRR